MLTSNLRGLALPRPAPLRRTQARKVQLVHAQPSHAHDTRTLRETFSNKLYKHVEEGIYMFCACPSSGCLRALIPAPADGDGVKTASCWRRIEGEGNTTKHFPRETEFNPNFTLNPNRSGARARARASDSGLWLWL